METVFQSGSLFTRDYLTDAIRTDDQYQSVDTREVEASLRPIFDAFPTDQTPNEAKTEDDLIWKVLAVLGWDQVERQVNLAPRGRDNIPDGLLFLDADAKSKANTQIEEWKKYQHGTVIVESKRWGRPLDRGLRKKDEATAPSTQMLRYLRRVDDLTSGNLRWGFLTNGAIWRLYYQGARSVSEQFFEIDLAALLKVRGDLLDSDDTEEGKAERDHWLRVFVLMFQRGSFAISATDPRTFHIRALEDGRFYEERVAKNLSDVVFKTVFPALARAIANDKPEASLEEVRHAALILLYRLLFLLYAEDRNLLPVRDERYDDYGLRDKVRGDVGRRKDANDTFSDTQDRYWSVIDGLSRAIDKGDASIGLPPYNGGLFNREATPLLAGVHVPDSVMAEVIDLLSYERRDGMRRYINYRDLSVQQLGSIYERLLEFEIKRDPEEGLVVRPNLFARKSSGSYYTPDELVGLILKETLEPLIEDKLTAFKAKATEIASAAMEEDDKISQLRKLDPAEALLTLRVCDPAMGSGHFLVNLVDFLADTVIETLAEVTEIVDWTEEPYTSPLADRIADIRTTIKTNADENNWTVDIEQLDDRHIIRRMVLKRCVYGVDKNEMAVELAKVALWLHTFTVGAPLSFLDHHLRCGDSLFGEWVKPVLETISKGRELLLKDSIDEALGSAASMQTIEGLTDAEIAEAHQSARIFAGVKSMTRPLDSFLKFWHALKWVSATGDKEVIDAWLDGTFGNPIDIASGRTKASIPKQRDAGESFGANKKKKAKLTPHEQGARFKELFDEASLLVDEERFLNWETAFPGVWQDWDTDRSGGFDAIVGNPPWDRYEFEEVHWFAERSREVAFATSGAARKSLIKKLASTNPELWNEFGRASARIAMGAQVAKKSGDYQMLSSGKLNLYKLFVERSYALLNGRGLCGLLVPSGIAGDKSSAKFFKSLATTGRIKAIFDFENRRTRYDAPPFFPDVDTRFKFTAFFGSPNRSFDLAMCGFFLQSTEEIKDPERCFPLTPADFARLNPNTGTAPILRSRREANLTRGLYSRIPVLADHSQEPSKTTWNLNSIQMINMTSDSSLFRTKRELEDTEGAWHLGGNIWESADGKWLPLYEGKMVQAFDHRAANVVVNAENQHRAAQPLPASIDQSSNPDWLPDPQYWIKQSDVPELHRLGWMLGFKDVTAPTNMRTMIASMLPATGAGNTLPILLPKIPNGCGDDVRLEIVREFKRTAPLLLANLNAVALDFVARQKVQGQHLNWFIVEQLPIVPTTDFNRTFGPKTAADIIKDTVLELTYTAHDMAPFARDMGYVDDNGDVLPPFPWDEARRLRLRAKLDAVFFHLYGIFDPSDREQSRDDIRYIYSTFPIVERQEMKAHDRYLSRDLALAYCNTLAAGQPDAEPEV